MSFIGLVPSIYFNVKQYGAAGNGTTDDTTAISSAIAAATSGGVIFFPPGTYRITTPLTLSVANTVLMGTGNASWLKPAGTFSGAQIILCSANGCGVMNMLIGFANTTSSGNPAANGIQITGVTGTILQNLLLQYINGYIVESLATAGQANYNTDISNVRGFQSGKGFHIKGVTGSSYSGVHRLYNCYSSQTQSGDGIFIEDCDDVVATNIFGECSAGSGNALHIKGACTGIFFSNVDIGYFPGPTAGDTVLIETSANGSPHYVTIQGGIIEGGTAGATVSSGANIIFANCHFYNNGFYGIDITGGDAIMVRDCMFEANGSTGTSGRFDLRCTVTSHVVVSGCYFYTPQGATAGKTNNAVTDVNSAMILNNCAFYGTGYTFSNIFASLPAVVRGCPGYNPVGAALSQPAVPATTVAYTNAFGVDCTVYVSNGTVTVVAVGGVTTGRTTGAFRVGVGQTITLTYSAAPSWVWFGD